MSSAARLRRWSHRLRVRVTAAALGVTLVAALVGTVLFLGALRQNLADSLVEGAGQQAAAVVARLEGGAVPADAVASGRDDVVVQVVDRRGVVVATDHREVRGPILAGPAERTGVRVRELDETFTVAARPGPAGRLVVVGVSEEGLAKAMGVAYRSLGIGVPLALLLVGAVVWVSVGRALRPVEVMRRQAAAIQAEHLGDRLAVPPGDDEIPLLAETLNDLLDRIDDAQRRQRQFVADASHELRSPLAAVRQLVDVARRHPGATSLAELAGEVGLEQARMEGLVTALLTLARLDDGENGPRVPVDLDELAHLEAERARQRPGAPTIDLAGVGVAQVSGDPVLLGQVLANLVANACRHATSRVRIGVAERDTWALLTVDDDGPGVPPADRLRVFERFTRLDEARARDAGGSGLGLAIVADVVALHGGTVEVSDSPDGGARFVVRLPLAGPSHAPRSSPLG